MNNLRSLTRMCFPQFYFLFCTYFTCVYCSKKTKVVKRHRWQEKKKKARAQSLLYPVLEKTIKKKKSFHIQYSTVAIEELSGDQENLGEKILSENSEQQNSPHPVIFATGTLTNHLTFCALHFFSETIRHIKSKSK